MNEKLQLLRIYIRRVLEIPDLDVRYRPAGWSYDPENPESDPNGFISIPNIHAKPRLKPEMVQPRTGVGFPDPKTKKIAKEIVKFVEFPKWDEEELFKRRTPEGGYKFSEVQIVRKPLGITIIVHTFGNKGRKQNDFRWSDNRFNKKEKIHSITYSFLYLDEEEKKSYIRVNPNHKKKEWVQTDPQFELKTIYHQRLQEAEELEELCYEIFAEFRKVYAEDFFPRLNTAAGVVYGFHKDVELDLGGTTTVKELLRRLEAKWLPFIELTQGYIDALFLTSEISKEENAVLYPFVKQLHKQIYESINFLKQMDPELIFVSTHHDIVNTGKNGPVRKCTDMMKILLQPRRERLFDEIVTDEQLKYSTLGKHFKNGLFDGYLKIEGDDFFPSLGEHIRKKERYDEPANDLSEQKIREEIKWFLAERKRRNEIDRRIHGK